MHITFVMGDCVGAECAHWDAESAMCATLATTKDLQFWRNKIIEDVQ